MPTFNTRRGTSIYYEINGQGPPVIFVHGLAANLKIWKPQVLEFALYFQVITFDLPGHGQSGQQSDYSVQEIPFIIKQLMDHLGLERAHIIGLSIGSTASVLFAAQYPEHVLSLILEGPAGGIRPVYHPFEWLNFIQLQLTVYITLGLWATLGKRKAGHIINWIGQTYKYVRFLTPMEEATEPKALVDYSYTNANNPYQDLLKNIRCFTLIIRGKDDQFPARYSQFLVDHLSSSLCFWIDVPNAQHLVSLTKTIEFNITALGFLQKIQHAQAYTTSEPKSALKSE